MLVPRKKLTENDTYDSRAADWSRDGTWIAYIQERPGARTKLVLESLETRAKRTFDPPIQGFERPRWTPDGGIILQGRDAQGRQGLFRLDGQTGEVTPIVVPADGTGAFQASVSPDGRRIIYRRQGARENVVVERDLASGSERELVRRESMNGVSLSPDGRQFTFIERDAAARDERALRDGYRRRSGARARSEWDRDGEPSSRGASRTSLSGRRTAGESCSPRDRTA